MPASGSIHTPGLTYAACRALDLTLSDFEDAKFFRNENAARAFLRRQKIKSTKAPIAAFPWLEWPLPVVSHVRSESSAPTLGDWKKADDIPPYDYHPTSTGELVESAIRQLDHGQTPWPTCCLDGSWHFGEIEKKAWALDGHLFESSRSFSFLAALWKAVLDFDIVVAGADRAAFFRSWQMHRHIAKLCIHLSMARPETFSGERHHAQWTIRSLVNSYGREIDVRNDVSPALRTRPAHDAGTAPDKPRLTEGIVVLPDHVSEDPKLPNDTTPPANSPALDELTTRERKGTRRRLSSSAGSPLAARRMEAYLDSNGIGQTEFAIQAQTTTRTLLAFRKSGKVRRDIFANIANAMGLTIEDLLRPE